MKYVSVIVVLLGLSSNAIAMGIVECKSEDSSVVITGTDSGCSIHINSAILNGTDLLRNKPSVMIGQVYDSDRIFDLGIVDTKNGFRILNLETMKSPNYLSGTGFISSGLAFTSGSKNVIPVKCSFQF